MQGNPTTNFLLVVETELVFLSFLFSFFWGGGGGGGGEGVVFNMVSSKCRLDIRKETFNRQLNLTLWDSEEELRQ